MKKTAEGKTPREARRALKRRLSNVPYRRILHDHQHAQKPPLDTQRRYQVTPGPAAVLVACPAAGLTNQRKDTSASISAKGQAATTRASESTADDSTRSD